MRLELSWAPASAAAATAATTDLQNSLQYPAREEGPPRAAPIPGTAGRVRPPPLARGRSRDRIRTHIHACSPAPRASSPLPRRPRQVEGWGRSGPEGVQRREPQKGFSA